MMELILPAALTLCIVIIALLQWRTNHHKLRLDLYDRRYKTYEAVMALLMALEEEVNLGGVDTSDAVRDFIRNTSSRHFLFKSDIDKFRDDLIDGAVNWRRKSEDEKEDWLSIHFEETPKIFRLYLYFGKL